MTTNQNINNSMAFYHQYKIDRSKVENILANKRVIAIRFIDSGEEFERRGNRWEDRISILYDPDMVNRMLNEPYRPIYDRDMRSIQ